MCIRDRVCSVGPYAITNFGMEAKKAQAHAMDNAKQVILDVAAEFEKVSGRKYGLYEGYELEDAEYVIVAIGSVCGTIKDAIDELRAQGIKAGLLKVRVFRPFPAEEFTAALKKAKAVAIMDRAESYSSQGGPLGSELMAAMYRAHLKAESINIVYGLCGRDVNVAEIKDVYAQLKDIEKNGAAGREYQYLGLRD